MSLNRSEKQAVIEEVTGLAAKAQTLVMAEYRGITVADMTKLRIDARSKGASFTVLKNSRRALSEYFSVGWIVSVPPLNRSASSGARWNGWCELSVNTVLKNGCGSLLSSLAKNCR